MYALMARTILLYLLIVAGLRIMGKRQIGELQPSELVVTILISNIATLPIQDVDVPLSGGIVPILTIVCFEVFISGLTMRSRTARRLFCGGPKMVIRDGQIMQKELRDLRFSVDDLIEQLRAAGYFDPSEVLFAVVETTVPCRSTPFAARPPPGGIWDCTGTTHRRSPGGDRGSGPGAARFPGLLRRITGMAAEGAGTGGHCPEGYFPDDL